MSDWQHDVQTLRKRHPKHILFLCVANSARSQLAEGIARSLASENVNISSAGSVPTQLRPEVVEVLKEIDIDASRQHSKGLDAIDAETVDAVITLCADEVCPLFPRQIVKLHWGLPDPAAASGSAAERLQAFRDVRDELMRRLALIF